MQRRCRKLLAVLGGTRPGGKKEGFKLRYVDLQMLDGGEGGKEI